MKLYNQLKVINIRQCLLRFKCFLKNVLVVAMGQMAQSSIVMLIDLVRGPSPMYDRAVDLKGEIMPACALAVHLCYPQNMRSA